MKLSKKSVFIIIAFSLLSISCQKKKSEAATETEPAVETPEPQKYLYYAAGGCHVGTLTASRLTVATASGIVNRANLDSGQVQGVPVFDYFQTGLNFWPVGITNLNDDYILANVMTSTLGFRVDKIKKSSLQEKTDFISDIVNLNTYLRSISLNSDGSVLISRSSRVEKYNAAGLRVQNTLGTNSFINTPAGSCNNSITLISSTISLPNGDILYTHAGGATNNRIGVIDKAGYDAAADCKSAITFSGTSSPATIANPTAAVLIPGTDPYQVIVSTASSTAGNDQLYLFTINSTTSAVTYVKSLYNDPAVLKGVSAMTYDSETNTLYAANGSTSIGNTVEKFTYDSTTQTLTSGGTFLGLNLETQCINSMFIAN